MASFTHYWTGGTCDSMAEYEGKPFRHTAGEGFSIHRILYGDQIYAVTVRRGILYLVGRLRVAVVCNQSDATEALNAEVWDATEHFLAGRRAMTPLRFQRKVSLRVTKLLRFPTKTGMHSLKFESRGLLDRQTLRGVRRLDDASAKLLDRLIK